MTKKRTFYVWQPISRAIVWKLKLAFKNPRAGNGRWIFPETEFVLILKIGETNFVQLEVNIPITIGILPDEVTEVQRN